MAGASAKRYAQAIFQIATERDLLDQLRADLDAISAVSQNEAFVTLMGSPRVRFEVKEELARQQFADLHPVALNVALILISKGRFNLAPAVAEEFSAFVDEALGIAHAEVTTAVPLSEAEQASVTQRLSGRSGKQIILHTRVDPSIIGGLVAKIGDQLIDGSTRNRLALLRRSLVQTG